MYVKETQTVMLEFPKEYYLLESFHNDKDWKEVSIGTVGATFEKITHEGFYEMKEKQN